MKSLVPAEIEAYAQAHSRPESEVRRALREETERTMEYAQMVVGPLEGAFLQMMAQLVGAKRVLEIGMFTGYSALLFHESRSLFWKEARAYLLLRTRKRLAGELKERRAEILREVQELADLYAQSAATRPRTP